jgi:hypothetical protein
MRDLGPASEDEVILAFLQAEIDSTRFGQYYAALLSNSGLERGSIVDRANLQSNRENAVRRKLLTAVRGYGNRTLLFRGFPQNVMWRKVAIEAEDADKLKYANYETWVQLSGGSRLVVDGAKGVDAILVGENANENIKAVANDLRAGKRYPALVAVESEGGFLILVEGHTRATAYVLARIAQPMDVFVGSSPQMKHWAFY